LSNWLKIFLFSLFLYLHNSSFIHFPPVHQLEIFLSLAPLLCHAYACPMTLLSLYHRNNNIDGIIFYFEKVLVFLRDFIAEIYNFLGWKCC
jgi:hypothetical protein